MVEALRPGVEINTLEHFINIDDMAVLRKSDFIPNDMKKEYLRRTFIQIGNPYPCLHPRSHLLLTSLLSEPGTGLTQSAGLIWWIISH